jgi:hypothetical protein
VSAAGESILASLAVVAAERARRANVAGFATRVAALKGFQQRRFSHTYADLLASARYGAVARFFLDELYGPNDFTRRDAQFARMVPAMVRLFTSDVVETVATVSGLHALTETLDTAMAEHLDGDGVGAIDYVRAWQAVGRPAERERQIAMTVDVAERLDRLVRKPLLGSGLRLMRGPARAAGLTELHRFLESGFETFREMKGASEFIAMVTTREHALAAALFGADLDGASVGRSPEHALALLP